MPGGGDDEEGQTTAVHDVRVGLIVRSNPTSARLWRRPCGVAWDAVPEPMVEYIDREFFLGEQGHGDCVCVCTSNLPTYPIVLPSAPEGRTIRAAQFSLLRPYQVS